MSFTSPVHPGGGRVFLPTIVCTEQTSSSAHTCGRNWLPVRGIHATAPPAFRKALSLHGDLACPACSSGCGSGWGAEGSHESTEDPAVPGPQPPSPMPAAFSFVPAAPELAPEWVRRLQEPQASCTRWAQRTVDEAAVRRLGFHIPK